MVGNYLLVARRNLLKRKLYSGINLLGLSTSICFCVLIYLFLQQEYSFDRFHAKAERIYRIDFTDHVNVLSLGSSNSFLSSAQQMGHRISQLPIPLGPALQQSLPEIAQVLRFTSGRSVIGNATDSYQEEVLYVDKNFFTFFSFGLLQGDAKTVLSQPGSIVLTPTLARKYFGDKNPVGKTLRVHLNQQPVVFTVTGIAQEAPSHSSIQFNLLLPFESHPSYRQYKNMPFSNYQNYTLVELRDKVSPKLFQKKLSQFAGQFFKDMPAVGKKDREIRSSQRIELTATSLPDAHFDNEVTWPAVSNRYYGYILSSLAGLILLVAVINYISLALTSASARLQEVGIRKVLGATRTQTIALLWVEALVLAGVALAVALLLIVLFLPTFNAFVDRELKFQLFQNLPLVIILLGLFILVTLLTGGYPALLLSGFKPIRVLTSNGTYRFNPTLASLMVVVQYGVCLFLITSAIVMYRQMRYALDKDLGFTPERVLVVENLECNAEKNRKLYDRFQQYAAGSSSIISVAGTSASFGNNKSMGMGMEFNEEKISMDFYVVDYNYIPVLNLKVVEGRNFSPRFATHREGVIINQTLANLLGNDAKVGQKSKQLGVQIIGVVADFHYLSLKQKIGPALIMLDPTVSTNFLVKLRPGNYAAGVAHLEKNWKRISDGQPFVYSFLEDDVANQYQEYTRWTNLLVIITGFAIFIACLGLFSLSGLNAINRTKEIGIRKVLGASVIQVILLLNRDIVRLAGLAFLLGVPLAWQLMQRWLEDFAYRIQIGWEVLIGAGLAGLFTALLAVSYHSLKASLANPVNSLRHE